MKRIICSIIMIVSCAAVAPADAKKKVTPTDPRFSNSPETQCFKQYGAYYDERERKWIVIPSENTAMSLADALRKCISEKKGIPRNQIRIPEMYVR